MKKITEIKFKTEYPRVFTNNNFIYAIDGNIFGQILDEKLNEIKEFSELLRTLNLPNKYFYFENFYNNNREGFLISTLTNTLVELQYLVDYSITFGNDAFFLFTNRNIPETLLFDINKKQVIWKHNKYFSFQILNEEYLIDIDNEKKSLIRYGFSTGCLLWQYNLPSSEFDFETKVYINNPKHHKAEIQRLIGVYSGILWVTLNSGRLLGLDVETGNLVYNISQINHYDSKKAIFSQYYPDETTLNPDWGFYFGKYLQLDESNGILFGLRNEYYFEIDLKNPTETYVLYDISESCKQWQTEPDMANGYQWAWEGNEIFFGKNFANGNNVGIFNRKLKEIVWATRIQEPDGSSHNFNKIDYAAGKLYVLDQANILHIFERE